MRRALLAALLLAAPALVGARAAAEVIRDFSVEIFLEENGDFSVVERIEYDFGAAARHGIFREIPLGRGEGFGDEGEIALAVQDVTDGAASARPWRVEGSAGLLRVRVGDPDVSVTGAQTYRIAYHVRHATRFFADHDELYWNATGDRWPVAIAHAEVRVYLPPAGDPGAAALRCFAGSHGSTRARCEARAEASAVAFEAQALAPAEGLTLVVGLPKGVLREPSAAARRLDAFVSRGGLWLAAPLAAFAFLFHWWRTRGRDPGARDAVPVRYEAPEGLSPAEVGTILDERADLEDLTATLLDLAVRGYLELQELDSPRFLFLSDRDFRLLKRRDADDTLKPHERALHEALFDGRDAVQVSALKHKFHEHVPRIQQLLYGALSGPRAFFPTSPDRVRRRCLGAGAAVLAGAFVLAHVGAVPLFGCIALGSAGAIIAGFARALPRRTLRGRRAYEEILGFREFLTRVDRDRLERMGGRSTDRFERVLPYALVLGAADAWADAFADLYDKPPSWYRSTGRGPFVPRRFVADLGGSLQTIGRTLAAAPPRSGGSGFGGGGFSGGGFGGGGGGSW